MADLSDRGVLDVPLDRETRAVMMFMVDMLGGSVTMTKQEVQRFATMPPSLEIFENTQTHSITIRIKE